MDNEALLVLLGTTVPERLTPHLIQLTRAVGAYTTFQGRKKINLEQRGLLVKLHFLESGEEIYIHTLSAHMLQFGAGQRRLVPDTS